MEQHFTVDSIATAAKMSHIIAIREEHLLFCSLAVLSQGSQEQSFDVSSRYLLLEYSLRLSCSILGLRYYCYCRQSDFKRHLHAQHDSCSLDSPLSN